jgi:HD-GYP domain-containing protein (c-di-GMP phosphodiesterase class II)
MIYKEIPHPLIRVDQKCTRDLYAKIKGDYRLFAAKGAVFTEEHARLFKKNRIRLYISAKDFESAKNYLDMYLIEVLIDPLVSPKVKADIVYSTSIKSIRQVFEGTNERTLSDLEKNSKNTIKLILSDGRVINDLIKITSHDHFTYTHSVKVGIYGTALAINLFQNKINEHNIAELSRGFFLHDIGMAKVPSKILDKKGPLTKSDWEIIKKHPIWGHDRLTKTNYLSREAAAIILYHHERFDGNGYPFQKAGDSIPLYSKICAIADTFESLTSTRPFRKPKNPFEALSIMQQEMVKEFDPQLFRAFIKLLGPGK